jgi:ubiquinone/menaquinone biosynthesis C-methylase UbiE
MKALLVVAVLVGIVVAVSLVWRGTSRSRPLPCPTWLTWALENPLMNAVAGADLLLDRAGVTAGMRVLDVGCGPGRIAIPAARRVGHAGHVTALDLQPGMLRTVETRAQAAGLSHLRTLHAAAGAGRLPEESYDRAVLVTVLGEIPDRAAALAEIFGALVPGGVLSVTEVIPDPHYQSRTVVRRFGEAAGFRVAAEFGTWLAFTINLKKPAAAA